MRRADALKRFRDRTVDKSIDGAIQALEFEGAVEVLDTAGAEAEPHTLLFDDNSTIRLFCVGIDRVGDPNTMVA